MRTKTINMMICITILFIIFLPVTISAKEYNYNLHELLVKSEPSDYKPTGLLKEMFNGPSDYTDLQRKNMLKELAGKVVLWRVPVHEISMDTDFDILDGEKETNRYKIRVISNDYVGCEILLFAQNDDEKSYLNYLKTGDMITIKGVLTGKTTLMRSLEIEPAVLYTFQEGNIIGNTSTKIIYGKVDSYKGLYSFISNYQFSDDTKGLNVSKICPEGSYCKMKATVSEYLSSGDILEIEDAKRFTIPKQLLDKHDDLTRRDSEIIEGAFEFVECVHNGIIVGEVGTHGESAATIELNPNQFEYIYKKSNYKFGDKLFLRLEHWTEKNRCIAICDLPI